MRMRALERHLMYALVHHLDIRACVLDLLHHRQSLSDLVVISHLHSQTVSNGDQTEPRRLVLSSEL